MRVIIVVYSYCRSQGLMVFNVGCMFQPSALSVSLRTTRCGRFNPCYFEATLVSPINANCYGRQFTWRLNLCVPLKLTLFINSREARKSKRARRTAYIISCTYNLHKVSYKTAICRAVS